MCAKPYRNPQGRRCQTKKSYMRQIINDVDQLMCLRLLPLLQRTVCKLTLIRMQTITSSTGRRLLLLPHRLPGRVGS